MGCGSSHSAGSWPHGAGPLPVSLSGRLFLSHASHLLVAHSTWRPAGPPRGVVYLVHGYAEHCGRYTLAAERLAGAGFLVHSMDLAGHGASEGDRGFVQRYAALCADIVQLATEVHAAEDAGLPRFLLGHSMGGLLALRVASGDFGGGAWAGAVLSAPLLMADPKTDTAINRWLARRLSTIWPQLGLAPLDAEALCTDRAIVDAYRRDPLCHHGWIKARTGAELMDAMADAAAALPRLRTPILILHGDADRVCLPQGSRDFAAAARAAGKDVALKEYPGLFHEIFLEPGIGPTCVADAAAWMAARLAPAVAAQQ